MEREPRPGKQMQQQADELPDGLALMDHELSIHTTVAEQPTEGAIALQPGPQVPKHQPSGSDNQTASIQEQEPQVIPEMQIMMRGAPKHLPIKHHQMTITNHHQLQTTVTAMTPLLQAPL
jgi:hypothetical protein